MGLHDFEKSVTPSKSIVAITINKRGCSKRIQLINKKGSFKKCEQCKTCKFSGKAQVGLGYYIEPTCDRDGATWRRVNGTTDKTCKHWEGGKRDE